MIFGVTLNGKGDSLMEQDIQTFLLDRVADLLGKPGVREELTISSSLADAGIDSVMLVNLIVQIEQKFELFFEDDELLAENFMTVEQITGRILEKLSIEA